MGFNKVTKVKIGKIETLTVNIDLQNRIINGQLGIIKHIELPQGSVRKVYVKFSMKKLAQKQ